MVGDGSMSKSNTHDDFDFGNDSEFQKNFNKNIDRVLSDIDFDSSTQIPSDVGIPNKKDKVAYEETAASIANEPTEDEDIGNEANTTSLRDTDRPEDNDDTDMAATLEDNDVFGKEATSEDKDDTETASTSEDNDVFGTVATPEDNDASEMTATIDNNENSDSEAVSKDTLASREETAASTSQLDSAEAIDETLYDINNSLAKQIGEELESLQAGNIKNKKKSRMMKIQIGVIIGLLSLLSIAFFLGFTKPGNQLLIKMGVNIGGKIWDTWTQDFADEPEMMEDEDYIDEDDIASDSEEIDPDVIVWPEHTGYGRREEGVYNILLLGEEAIGSGTSRGRTDLIIIATLNKNSKSIKLTSLMRDTLVQIPGYKENKLNTAYEKGDVDLLYETISLNFNVHIDGGVLVNFENFEEIIDYMGGLELTLTNSEAKYLRNTNYISNPRYRTVVGGTQLMNGNQILGYSRIRKRAAITGDNNDYGRTDRHRIILNAIFEKYKTNSELELATVMIKMIPMVKTDIDSKTFEKLLTTFIEMRTMEINQLRIPADGTFTDNVKVRGMDVLIPDLNKNVSILHDFIFED